MSPTLLTRIISAIDAGLYINTFSTPNFIDLPSELVREIFLLVGTPSSSSFKDIFALSHANQRLYAIASTTPEIWAWNIDLSRRLDATQFFLQRSGTYPLILRVPLHFDLEHILAEEFGGPRFALWQTLITNDAFFRCESLEVEIEYTDWGYMWDTVEPYLTVLPRLSMHFKPEGKVPWDVVFYSISSDFRLKTSESVVYSQMTALSLTGAFFTFSATMFPALLHLDVTMSPEENWTAAKWHEVLMDLPTLETVSLTDVIYLRDALDNRSINQNGTINTVNLSNLKSFKIKDHHTSIAHFLQPCIMSMKCNISIDSTATTPDLNPEYPIRARFVRFLSNRLSNDINQCPVDFGNSGRVEILKMTEESESESGSEEQFLMKVDLNHDSGDGIMTELSLRMHIELPNNRRVNWYHRAWSMLRQLLLDGMHIPLSRSRNERWEEVSFYVDGKELRESLSFAKICNEVIVLDQTVGGIDL